MPVPVPVPVPVPESGRSGSGQTSQHGDDPLEQLERGRQDGGGDGLAAVEDVEDRRSLGRRASSHPIEALLLERSGTGTGTGTGAGREKRRCAAFLSTLLESY